jgi:threonyl-tRNA synthetase
MESDKQYRAEKPGQIGGLNRVIAITVEDGHSFCRVHQIKDEIKNIINIIKDFYSSLGLWEENHWISLSVRDYNHLENYIGEEGDWNECENILKEIDKIMELNAHVCEGEAALYGPKIDFMFKDALGRELQVATVQLDFATPKRFNLVYTDEQGKEQNPVMIHRAILGSYERFLMILLEHFKGAFPIWLSPVQVKLISVGKKHIDGVKKMADEFKQEDIRVETDLSEETVGNKIRKATQEKIPYVLVIGDKELNSNTLNVRERGQEDTVEISKEEFIKEVKGE